MKKEKFNQIEIESNISKEDQAILDYKPRFRFLWRLWIKVWVFFNRPKEP